MTAASLAYLMSAFLLVWGALRTRVHTAYTCPTCGTKRTNAHSAECPWSSRP
jgi:hypothetical protein